MSKDLNVPRSQETRDRSADNKSQKSAIDKARKETADKIESIHQNK